MTNKIQDRLREINRIDNEGWAGEDCKAAADYIDKLEQRCEGYKTQVHAGSIRIDKLEQQRDKLAAALQEIAVHRADVDGYHFANCIAKAALSDKSQGKPRP